MKFVVRDDVVLGVAAAGSALFGVHFLIDPKKAHQTYFSESIPQNDSIGRWVGYGMTGMALQGVSVSAAENSKEAKKAMLKTTGALWALSAGLDAYGAHEGNMKTPEIGYACAGVGAALAALCLWRGFAEDEKWESKEFFKKKDEK